MDSDADVQRILQLLQLGEAAETSGDLECALKYNREVMELAPMLFQAAGLVGRLNTAMRRYVDASEAFASARGAIESDSELLRDLESTDLREFRMSEALCLVAQTADRSVGGSGDDPAELWKRVFKLWSSVFPQARNALAFRSSPLDGSFAVEGFCGGFLALRLSSHSLGTPLDETDIAARDLVSRERAGSEEGENDAREIVWGERLDPVRARIINVPTPASGYRYGDVVLVDTMTSVAVRKLAGETIPVFGVHRALRASPWRTVAVVVTSDDDDDDFTGLVDALAKAGFASERWDTLRVVCAVCATPECAHHIGSSVSSPIVRLGVAAPSLAAVRAVAEEWAAENDGTVESIEDVSPA